jgi:hypothetical protein
MIFKVVFYFKKKEYKMKHENIRLKLDDLTFNEKFQFCLINLIMLMKKD